MMDIRYALFLSALLVATGCDDDDNDDAANTQDAEQVSDSGTGDASDSGDVADSGDSAIADSGDASESDAGDSETDADASDEDASDSETDADASDEDVVDEDVVDEDVVDEDVVDEDVVDEDVVDEDVVDEDVVDEDIVDEDIVDEDIVDEDIVDEDIVDEDVVDEDSDCDHDRCSEEATIHEINSGNFAQDALVELRNVVVTGVNKTETTGHPIFVQMLSSDLGDKGVKGSGLYVYMKKTEMRPEGVEVTDENRSLPEVRVGDIVNLAGKVQMENGYAWLNFGRQPTVDSGLPFVASRDHDLPEAVSVSASDLSDPGYNGVRVKLSDVRITDTAPVVDDPEFKVTGDVTVDEFLYEWPNPRLNDHFNAISGVYFDYTGRTATIDKASRNGIIPQGGLLPGSESDFDRVPRLEKFEPSPLTMPLRATRKPKICLDQEVKAVTEIPLTCTGDIICAESAAIAVGEKCGEFTILSSDAGSASVTASFDGEDLTLSVAVENESEVAVSAVYPTAQKRPTNSSTHIRVDLAAPAPAGGQLIYVTDDPVNYTQYGIISYEGSFIIPEGDQSIDIPITTGSRGTGYLAVYSDANMAGDDPSTQLIKASIEVIENYPTGLLISEALVNPTPGSDDGREWVVLYNSTGERQDISNYSLRFGSASQNFNFTSTTGKYIFNIPEGKVLEVGDCLVIGGPTSDANNGNPEYDVEWNNVEYMNNGSKSSVQGLALFDAEGAQGDTLIYGGATNDKIAHADGSKTIDLPWCELPRTTETEECKDGNPLGGSLKRTRTGAWEGTSQSALKPNECPPF